MFPRVRPKAPRTPREAASLLAGRCRALRDAVSAAIAAPSSQLRARLGVGAEGGEAECAEAFAQTIACALWIDHLDHPGTPTRCAAARARLEATPGPLTRALATAEAHREEIAEALAQLEAAVSAVEVEAVSGADEGLYFFERFLAAYDGRLRREAGAYYTPAEVVHAQIVAAEELLARRFAASFADPRVVTFDPACGTGVYPLAIVQHSLARAQTRGEDVAGCARQLGRNLHAYELLAGPCAIAHARLTRALQTAGASLPPEGAQVRRMDTLARADADDSAEGEVCVCIGNPPYDRRELAEVDRGGWIRHGDPERGERAPLADFLPDARGGRHAKNVYNEYVYFWRWALRRACERPGRGGVVCLITPSSYLRGPGFAAMRRHLRRTLDELWIVDLGGDALGPRPSANVFVGVRTPVCIAVGVRSEPGERSRPGSVWYTRLDEAHDRGQKLATLGALRSLGELEWTAAPDGWEAPFIPAAAGGYATWPRLVDIFPWQHAGAQWKRTWPIAEAPELLTRRWRALLQAEDRAAAFRETEAWTIARARVDLFDGVTTLPPLASLPPEAPPPPLRRIAWRALDRRWCLADARLGDRLRPPLWRCHGPAQRYLTTLLSSGLSAGPAVFACAEVPDLHHFRGSFGDKGVIPLWRDAAATAANVTGGLINVLEDMYGEAVTPEALFAYVYGCLGHPGYVAALAEELAEPGPRVPLTRDAGLFARCAALGAELLQLHTYARVPAGAARCLAPVTGMPRRFGYADGVLTVGEGRFEPVAPEVWSYAVSGLKPVTSWLSARMLRPGGRTSSPLDRLRPEAWPEAWTRELLELLWVIEGSLALHAAQAELFREIVAGGLVTADELPQPSAREAAPP